MIESQYFWTNVVLLGIGAFAVRFAIIAVSTKVKITDRQRELFTFIPAAILPAMTAPMVFYHEGHVPWLLGKERAVILIFATVVCYYSRNLLVTLTFGLASLYLVSQI